MSQNVFSHNNPISQTFHERRPTNIDLDESALTIKKYQVSQIDPSRDIISPTKSIGNKKERRTRSLRKSTPHNQDNAYRKPPPAHSSFCVTTQSPNKIPIQNQSNMNFKIGSSPNRQITTRVLNNNNRSFNLNIKPIVADRRLHIFDQSSSQPNVGHQPHTSMHKKREPIVQQRSSITKSLKKQKSVSLIE